MNGFSLKRMGVVLKSGNYEKIIKDRPKYQSYLESKYFISDEKRKRYKQSLRRKKGKYKNQSKSLKGVINKKDIKEIIYNN